MDTYIPIPLVHPSAYIYSPLDAELVNSSHSKKHCCYLDEITLVSLTIDTSIEQKKFQWPPSAYILQEITGNANIEISLGGLTPLVLSKGKFTRNPRSRCDGESQPPPSPSSAGRSER